MEEINCEKLEKIINENDYVVVDVSGKWCNPCKTLLPIMERLSENMTDVEFCKIDVEENPDIATEFQIRSIPTLLFFKNGEHVNSHVGMIQESKLVSKINDLKNE